MTEIVSKEIIAEVVGRCRQGEGPRLCHTGPIQSYDLLFTSSPNSPALEHLGLQPPLQEIFLLQSQHVIQPHPRVIQHTDSDQSSNQGVSFEESFGVLVVEFEEFSGSSSNLKEVRQGRNELWKRYVIFHFKAKRTLDKVN